MPKYNDIDIKNWKSSEIVTDSLWLIPERDKSGKHSGEYHGNFVPQIPHQVILRYTKQGDTVLDPFVGSGTTAFEAESLSRNLIGIDIRQDLIDSLKTKISPMESFTELVCANSADENSQVLLKELLHKHNKTSVQLAILHPPYHDIIKFSDNPYDLSNSPTLDEFLLRFNKVLSNTISILDKHRYLVIVMGDKYTKGEWIPLGFYCMQEAQKHNMTLKSIVIKDIQGNRGKQNQNSIWRYRALSSDYFIFKHEYILILKKGG